MRLLILLFAAALTVALSSVLFVRRHDLLKRYAKRRRWAHERTPKHIRERLKLRAALRRVKRGLRYPTVQERRKHQRFKYALTKALKRAHDTNTPISIGALAKYA